MNNETLSRIFQETMRRERKKVTAFSSGESFYCFFRKSNDNLNEHDTILLYYYPDAPIRTGSLITYKDETYLLINQETIENETYLKSAAIKTNGVMFTHSLSCIDLPFYGENVNNDNQTYTTHYNIIDGNVDILTEDCKRSRAVKVNDTLNEWGRTWKVTNTYFIDGIAHIVLEVTENEEFSIDYSIKCEDLALHNVMPGDTAKLTAIPMANDIEAEGKITYESSNEEVATIDQNGNIEYIAVGEVQFTAAWAAEKLGFTTSLITVADTPVDENVEIFVSDLDEIAYDFSETLTYYAAKGGVKDDTIPISFKIENISVKNNYNVYAKKISVVDNGDNTITLSVNGSVMLGKTFDLVAYNSEYGVENRQTIKTVSLF